MQKPYRLAYHYCDTGCFISTFWCQNVLRSDLTSNARDTLNTTKVLAYYSKSNPKNVPAWKWKLLDFVSYILHLVSTRA